MDWNLRRPATFDICVVSPLNTNILFVVGATAGKATEAAELKKHITSDMICAELSGFASHLWWNHIEHGAGIIWSMGQESYGAWGRNHMEHGAGIIWSMGQESYGAWGRNYMEHGAGIIWSMGQESYGAWGRNHMEHGAGIIWSMGQESYGAWGRNHMEHGAGIIWSMGQEAQLLL